MTVTIYGIKNCDTMKKAFKWLEQHNVAFNFHDYRKDGIDSDFLASVLTQLDWQQVVNKRGTTYRNLSEEQKEALGSDNVVELLVAYPAMIKRPLLQIDSQYYLGFNANEYQELFS